SKIVQKLNELDLVEASKVKEFLKLFKRHYQLVDKREELASSKHGQLDEYKRSLTVGRRKCLDGYGTSTNSKGSEEKASQEGKRW
ncbi:7237_t:CDS:1, partial [Paraglomus occultum]